MIFNYCSLIYEYDFIKLNTILEYYSTHFTIHNIIDYKVNKKDINSFMKILYSYDIHCNKNAIEHKVGVLNNYLNDTQKESIKIKFIILECLKSDVYNDKTNNYIRNIKKGLRQLIAELDNNKSHYLPIHITDYKKDSIFLNLLIYKLTTSYTLKNKNNILNVERDINNVPLMIDSTMLLFFSKHTDKHKDDKIYLGTNHSSDNNIINIDNLFRYNVGISNILEFRKEVKK